jgi:ATP-dependent Clp protease ATP-binding subunit ClpA
MNKLNLILKKAESERDKLNHPYVGTEHLTLAILSQESELTEDLKKYNLTYNKFKKKLVSIIGIGTNPSNYILYTPMLRNVLEDADKLALGYNKEVTEKELFQAILDEGEGIAIRVMQAMKIKPEEIVLDNSTDFMKYSLNDIVSDRDNEISLILQILMRKDKCNPLLIGDAGVGKTAIVEEIARRLSQDKVPAILKNYKIMKIDLSELLSGTKYRGEFEEKLNKLLHQAINKKIILFIDEIHTLVTAGGADGAIAAGDIVKPYLARGDIKCIGATTINEYHEYFIKDQALNRRFQTVIINETSPTSTLNILNKIKPNYENFHHISIDNTLIKEIINIGNLFLINRRNPDKSIELLDSCCTYSVFNERKSATTTELYELLYERYGINLANQQLKEIILNHKIITTSNSENLISKLNNNCNIIHINGQCYKETSDTYDLIGNPQDLHNNQSYLLKSALDKPLGVIAITNISDNKILKEFIEKMLTNRIITDNFGNKINLTNYLFIMERQENNSNIGFTSLINADSVNHLFIQLEDSNLINI